MTQPKRRDDTAVDSLPGAGQAHGERLQIELDAPLLQRLLREKRLQAAQLRACNPGSARLIRHLLLGCLRAEAPGKG